jgi:hypothetical protein
MLAEMPASLFNEWRAYYDRFPFGPEWDWFRGGMLLSTISNMFRGKDSPVAKPEDYMPSEKKLKPKIKKADSSRRFKAFATAARAKIVDLSKPRVFNDG